MKSAPYSHVLWHNADGLQGLPRQVFGTIASVILLVLQKRKSFFNLQLDTQYAFTWKCALIWGLAALRVGVGFYAQK